ncbi:hypothetical protein HID58_088102 [Brassica napus]|uniref:Uncharacterized protein n=1 Tax=Brassica napus TaxID=3708 RepID=A0ABQ7XXT3_BRANA|nr:hypothetical protein HID58_088102 [Brassica napus]
MTYSDIESVSRARGRRKLFPFPLPLCVLLRLCLLSPTRRDTRRSEKDSAAGSLIREAFGVSVNSLPVVILLAVSKSSLRCGEEYRSSLSFWFVVLGFVSCSGKAVVVHRLRVHRSVVAVRWLHLCGFGACLLLLSPRFPIEEHLKRREDRWVLPVMGGLLKTLSSQYYFEVARSLRRQFFSSLQRCVALTTNLTLVALQGFMMVTDISFEEIIRASYSGDDIGIPGIQDNKENLTFPSFIVDS